MTDTAIALQNSPAFTLVDPKTGENVPFLASFDTTSEEGSALALNAANAADGKIADHIGEQIEIQGYYIEPIVVTDETTGVSTLRGHSVIITIDGEALDCQSKLVASFLPKLDEHYFSQGKTVTVVPFERKAKVGRSLNLKIIPKKDA